MSSRIAALLPWPSAIIVATVDRDVAHRSSLRRNGTPFLRRAARNSPYALSRRAAAKDEVRSPRAPAGRLLMALLHEITDRALAEGCEPRLDRGVLVEVVRVVALKLFA